MTQESPAALAGAKVVNDGSIWRNSMATVTAFQPKTPFGELLDRVVRGEEVVITRHEKAVARLAPEGGANLEHTRQVAAELRARRLSMAKRQGFKPRTDLEIKGSIEEWRP